jgi:2'-hydroxyisoflavone reductase
MIRINRRKLLMSLGLAGISTMMSPRYSNAQGTKPLKILILGGTGFIGPHIVREALERGHEVTLFNRGRSNTHLFPEVKRLVGDRDGGLSALETGEWDVALDNSGYVPRQVEDSAKLLKNRVGTYLFTSSISAYDLSDPEFPLTKNSKLNPWTNPDSEDVGKYYGEFKAQCERLVQATFGDRALIVRPTYIVGPGDKSERFTWWVDRVHRGGEVLAPGNPDTTFEIIDVRDLAGFYIRLLENAQTGTFNATGPAGRFSYGGMLKGIRATTSDAVNFTWVDSGFLTEQQVDWKEMPMFNSEEDGFIGIFSEQQSSIDAGLSYRPFTETVKDTLAWHRQLPPDKQVFTRAGIDPEKEASVLAAWHKHQLTSG